MHIDWVAVQGVATSILVLTSVGAIAYAGLQLRHERDYRSVDNLEKQLTFFLSDNFVGARRRLAQARLDVTGDEPDEIQLKRMHDQNLNHWTQWTPDRMIQHYRYELESGGRPRRSRRAAARQVAREVVKAQAAVEEAQEEGTNA